MSNNSKIVERREHWRKRLSDSNIQEFRGDATRDNICYEAMQKIGCPLYASNMDYQSMKSAIECLLEDLMKHAKETSEVKTEKEIRKAIKDSEKYFKYYYPDMKVTEPVISIKEVEKGIKALAVANEVCTLKWVLGKGKLNCYG